MKSKIIDIEVQEEKGKLLFSGVIDFKKLCKFLPLLTFILTLLAVILTIILLKG